MKSKFFRFFIMIMCAMGISVPAAGCGFGAFGGAVSDTAVETTEESTENEDKKDSKEETTEASVVRAGEPEENVDLKTSEAPVKENETVEIKEPEEQSVQLAAQEAEELRIQQEERAQIEAALKEEQKRAEAAMKEEQERIEAAAIEAARRQQEEINRINEENKRKLDEYNAKVAAHNARVNNYHRSDVVAESFGTVNLSPAYVIYGDDGALYALMYVYNGLERPAYNIVADYIELYDLNGNLIARDENIGIGGGGAIGAKDYATWMFVFSGDKLKMKDADLTKGLIYKSGANCAF